MSFFAFDGQKAAMPLYNLTGNKEPDAKSGKNIFAFPFNTIKAFKYFPLIFFINANSIIFYAHRNLVVIILMNRYFNLIAVCRILDGIVNQVDNYLAYSVLVTINSAVKFPGNVNNMFWIGMTNIFNRFNHQIIEVY